MNLTSIKQIFKYKPIIIFIVLAISSCETTITPPDLEMEREDLLSASSWNVSEVSQSGNDISEAFTGATITFQSDGSYTTTIDPIFDDAWPANGSWLLLSVDLISVNGVEMTLSNVSASSITLSYVVQNSGGRISGLDGDYVMKLNR